MSNVTVQFTKLEEAYGLNVQEVVAGLQLTGIGLGAYVLVPLGLASGGGSAQPTLLAILVIEIVSLVMVARYALPWASRQLVSFHCFIQAKIFCNREAEKLKPLVLKNLRSHKERNIKTGTMFITTVLFTMFLNSLALQVSEMVLSTVSRVLGSDLSVA